MKRTFDRIGWLTAAALAVFVMAAFAGIVSGGPLDPPQGVSPTYKTLHEVEPRTAISSLPLTISQPGSYYLTNNLTGVFGSAGITISANNVSLDLNGFALTGVNGSLDGIAVPSARTGISVRNGSVTGWGGDGVDGLSASSSEFADLVVRNNAGDGLRAGTASRVADCGAYANFGDGLQLGAKVTVSNCYANDNGAAGIRVTNYARISDCTVTLNTEDGITASGVGNTITGCVATANEGDGIQVHFSSVVRANIASDNGVTDGAGIHVTGGENRIEGNHVVNNDRGVDIDQGVNVIVRNSGRLNTTEFDIVGVNFTGTIVTTAVDMNVAPNALVNMDQ